MGSSIVVKIVAPFELMFSLTVLSEEDTAPFSSRVSSTISTGMLCPGIPDPLMSALARAFHRLLPRVSLLQSLSWQCHSAAKDLQVTFGRPLADERYAHFENGRRLCRRQWSCVTHQRPDSVLIFHMIENSQLSRHGNRHVQQPASFDRSFESEARAERSDVDEASDFNPLQIRCLATLTRTGILAPTARECASRFSALVISKLWSTADRLKLSSNHVFSNLSWSTIL